MHRVAETNEQVRALLGRPQLIFFTELDNVALAAVLLQGGLVEELAAQHYGVALALHDLTDERASLVRLLNLNQVMVVAWLLLSPDEGLWFNLQNYPQAVESYRTFHAWAERHQLHFDAVGLDFEPPAGEVSRIQQWGFREVLRRFWLARENVLYPAARAAYTDLIAEIRHDGYEVHTYQLPLLADDRRAGTTIVQRALDIVDLPADVEVLMCYSSLPIESLSNDLGGALIASYGPAADSIGVGSSGGSGGENTPEGLPPLSWEGLERDLLLAAHHTDTIYVYSLEGCVERGLLSRLATLNWDAEPHVRPQLQALVAALRSLLLLTLLLARFSRWLLAWLGWVLALILLAQQLRRQLRERNRERREHPPT